jgi:hypothetical protein
LARLGGLDLEMRKFFVVTLWGGEVSLANPDYRVKDPVIEKLEYMSGYG